MLCNALVSLLLEMDVASGEELGRSLILKNYSERLKGVVENRQEEDYIIVTSNK